eukprot:jgi/Psemu1/322256/estExt_fgenesh1_pg.C_230016
MEEGSLLQAALQHAKTLRTSAACESLQKNCILLDLHALGYERRHREDQLLLLAELAEYCNQFFQNKGHLWHYGADGPIFGIHIDESDSVPHLRAYCRYGPSVQDGWMAIQYTVDLIKSVRDDGKKQNIVASTWDVQDGQVILIQLADLLPAWLDEDPTDNHRYACWIDQDGNLQLFHKSHITLCDALKELECRNKLQTRCSSHPTMQRAFNYWLELNTQAASVHQRAPMVLPRKVAGVFRDRPELLLTAIQAFCESIQQDGPIAPAAIELDLTKYEDWVWTVQTLSRTNYAMARTVSSSRSDWTSSPDSIPISAGPEVKRVERQCKMVSMKHLKHAVALGVRAVAGLEQLMTAGKNDDESFASSRPLSSLEERIVYWTRVQRIFCGHDAGDISKTILESYHMGPNRSDLDLTNVLKCPVFPEEDHNWTSYSSPQVSLRDQIKSAMRRQKCSDNEEDNAKFWVPLPEQVDGEDWMEYELTKSETVNTVESEHDVDNLLPNLQSFLKQTSEVEGISSKHVNRGKTDNSSAISIRPRIFLNILHSVLKGKQLDFAQVDPFFYREDYDLMEEDSDNNNEGAHDILGVDGTSFEMNDLITAMDKELEARTESRRIPSNVLDGSGVDANNDDEKAVVDGLAQDAHILSNLMQSLDATGGGTGPVGNILKEMEGAT